jgi:hypothetical protein
LWLKRGWLARVNDKVNKWAACLVVFITDAIHFSVFMEKRSRRRSIGVPCVRQFYLVHAIIWV